MKISFIKLFVIALLLLFNQTFFVTARDKAFSKLPTSEQRITQEFSEPITADKLLFFIEKIKTFIIKNAGKRSAPSTSKKIIIMKALIDAHNVYMQLQDNKEITHQILQEILIKIADLSVQLQDMGLQDLQENNQALLDQFAEIQ